MKKLNMFMIFDYQKFLNGKKLMLINSKSDSDCLKSVLLVVEDNTTIEGYPVNCNEFERIFVKTEDKKNQAYITNSLKRKDYVELYDIEKATVWGEFRENLTIYAKIRKYN